MAGKRSPSPLVPPESADFVLEFVNTHAGGRSEQFGDADGLREWLIQVGFADEGVTDADAADAREFRDALQTLLLAHAGDEHITDVAVQDAQSHLQRIGARYPLTCEVRVDGITLAATQSGVIGAFSAIFSGISDLAYGGTWPRLKACRNDPCHEAFFDKSRNGSAIYHAAGCSSMVAMRSYRERKRSAVQPGGDGRSTT
nr:CGNR zinc finger domain-containing protein [Rhodococcus sp. (in: high G+C Gram-positive bacteria)]